MKKTIFVKVRGYSGQPAAKLDAATLQQYARNIDRATFNNRAAFAALPDAPVYEVDNAARLAMLNPDVFVYDCGSYGYLYNGGDVIWKRDSFAPIYYSARHVLSTYRRHHDAATCARCGRSLNKEDRSSDFDAVRVYDLDGSAVVMCRHCAAALRRAVVINKAYDGSGKDVYVARAAAIFVPSCNLTVTVNYAVRNLTYCPRCRTWHEVGLVTVDGVKMCLRCALKRGYGYCKNCGEWQKVNRKTGRCRTCEERIKKAPAPIYDYNHGERTDYNGGILHGWDGAAGDFCGVGWEQEVDGDVRGLREVIAAAMTKPYTTKHVALEGDGSLRNGCEVVSARHTLAAARDYLIKQRGYANALKAIAASGKADANCPRAGLHVHISRNLIKNNADAIARLLYIVSKHRDAFNSLSRRNLKADDDYWKIRDYTQRGARDYVYHYNGNGCGERYQAINLRNAATIEWRLFATTLDARTVYDCIALAYYVTEQAARLSWEDCDDLQKVFDAATMPANVAAYVKKHAARWLQPAAAEEV